MLLGNAWNELNRTQQAVLSLVGIIIVISLLVTSYYIISDKNYGVLFSDLQEHDAAAIMGALEKASIDYQLANNGTQILVPQDSVHKTRISLLGSDLPINGGVGFEIFDDSSFGTSEFAQKVNFQRALQGELTRTITALKEVKRARVHLVMPEGGLFKRKGQAASASVTLFLHDGMTLDANQVVGVQRLISASVPQLIPENVILVDQSSNVLSARINSKQVEIVNGELSQKKTLENYLKGKAEEVLRGAFGDERFTVSVDATIDYNESTITKEDIIPSDVEAKHGLLRSKEFVVPGKEEKTSASKITREEEYLVGRSVSKTTLRAGSIKNISVGVLVPPSTPTQVVENVKSIVSMAVGINFARGDNIVVYPVLREIELTSNESIANVEIQQPALVPPRNPEKEASQYFKAPALEHLQQMGFKEDYIWYSGFGLFLLILVLTIAGFLRKDRDSLTRQEREQLMITLQTWVNSEDNRENVVELR